MFTHVPAPKVNRSLFDLSHEVKFSGKFGYLYPVLCIEAMPGDTIRDQIACFMRMAPMLAPVMHRIDVTCHSFFIPIRLLTNLYESFFTGGQDGTEAPVLPYVRLDQVTPAQVEFNICSIGSLWDYLGLPTSEAGIPGSVTQEGISDLPFRAAAKVWNDWYRDPNFDDEMDIGFTLSGNVTANAISAGGRMDIRAYRRMYEKDYFTSALESPQRGSEVLIPLTGQGTWEYFDPDTESQIVRTDGTPITLPAAVEIQPGAGDGGNLDTTGAGGLLSVENIKDISFENATSTMNDLRTAMALQRWAEANARGGPRYVEVVKSQFNVTVPDYRLQRSEYLGGGKQPVQIAEVLKTAGNEDPTRGVGEMYGHGSAVANNRQWTYRCEEHGFVMTFLSVTFRTAYMQGLSRMWSRLTKFDYPWPLLANLGEQPILSKELFFSYDAADSDENNETFGYIPRYAEFKYHPDRVAGDFKNTLAIWHLARFFVERPVLGSEFTTIFEEGGGTLFQDTSRRIFQVEDGTDYLWFQLYHHLTAKRPLPYFGVPSGL